jgi:hypothetical protein
MMKIMNEIITPAMVEQKLRGLSKEVDEAHKNLVEVETIYHNIKAEYEIAMAKSRITLSTKSSPTGKNYTVGEREDLALVQNEELHKDLGMVQAKVLASRANTNRLKMQVDIARSVGTSVRTSMDLT